MKNRDLFQLIDYIQNNIENNKYTPLNKLESQTIRNYYQQQFNELIKLPYNNYIGNIYDKNNNIQISNGYERLVIGDYGAYLEINNNQIIKSNLIIKRGQEWRLDNIQYPYTKYHWYSTSNEKSAKIYYQINVVKYADYKINYWYVSPWDVIINKM